MVWKRNQHTDVMQLKFLLFVLMIQHAVLALGFCMLKAVIKAMDADKAFNRVHWGYLSAVIQKFDCTQPLCLFTSVPQQEFTLQDASLPLYRSHMVLGRDALFSY